MINPYIILEWIGALGGIVLLVVILALAKGRSRLLGSIGMLLIVINTVGSMIFLRVYNDVLSQAASSDPPALLVVNSAIQTVLYGGGILLLGLAVTAGRNKG